MHIHYKDHKSVIKHILCDQKHIIHYSLSNSKQSPMQFMTFMSWIMLGVLMINDTLVVLPFFLATTSSLVPFKRNGQ